MLINHFDLSPSAQEAWMVDKNGGISHWDTRESKKESGRRRWVVQEEGRGAKLGGISVNRKFAFLDHSLLFFYQMFKREFIQH